MAFRLVRCLLCDRVTTFRTTFVIHCAGLEFNMDVCGVCFESAPGWSEEGEAAEDLVRAQLELVAIAYIENNPWMQAIIVEPFDTASTATPPDGEDPAELSDEA